MYDEQKQKQLTKAIEEKQEEIETNLKKSEEFVEEIVEIPDTEPPKVVILEDVKDWNSSSLSSAVESESERSYLSYIPFVGWFFKGSSSDSINETKSEVAEEKSENCGCESKAEPTKAKKDIVGDHGMSNPDDKDMYSTRE